MEDNASKFNVLIPLMLSHRHAVLKGSATKNVDVRQLTDELESLTLEKNCETEVFDTQRSQLIDASENAQKCAEIRRPLRRRLVRCACISRRRCELTRGGTGGRSR